MQKPCTNIPSPCFWWCIYGLHDDRVQCIRADVNGQYGLVLKGTEDPMSQLTGICQQGGDTPGIQSFIAACAALCRARCCCCYVAMEKRSASVLEAFYRTATQSGFKVVRHSHPLRLRLCLFKKSPTAGGNWANEAIIKVYPQAHSALPGKGLPLDSEGASRRPMI